MSRREVEKSSEGGKKERGKATSTLCAVTLEIPCALWNKVCSDSRVEGDDDDDDDGGADVGKVDW